ncbi:hypothetical protein MUK42_34958 [Musa troglodytarum]|uniref:Uncharacterized protein n=1 Tax=Musa troglodytarum TaxID=320322 RepID=A0A9E7EB52_9LILI|nr:hypothetical protein MUK42_34958 [Musa troglodytarum]
MLELLVLGCAGVVVFLHSANLFFRAISKRAVTRSLRCLQENRGRTFACHKSVIPCHAPSTSIDLLQRKQHENDARARIFSMQLIVYSSLRPETTPNSSSGLQQRQTSPRKPIPFIIRLLHLWRWCGDGFPGPSCPPQQLQNDGCDQEDRKVEAIANLPRSPRISHSDAHNNVDRRKEQSKPPHPVVVPVPVPADLGVSVGPHEEGYHLPYQTEVGQFQVRMDLSDEKRERMSLQT